MIDAIFKTYILTASFFVSEPLLQNHIYSGVLRMICLLRPTPMVVPLYFVEKRGFVVVVMSGLDIWIGMSGMLLIIFSNVYPFETFLGTNCLHSCFIVMFCRNQVSAANYSPLEGLPEFLPSMYNDNG